jgi:hypothetical protein
MRIDNETVRASHAMRDFMRLCDAYRATARSQIAAIQQIRRHLTVPGAPTTAQRTSEFADLGSQEALIVQTDAVFAQRREQIRRRLNELLEVPNVP